MDKYYVVVTFVDPGDPAEGVITSEHLARSVVFRDDCLYVYSVKSEVVLTFRVPDLQGFKVIVLEV